MPYTSNLMMVGFQKKAIGKNYPVRQSKNFSGRLLVLPFLIWWIWGQFFIVDNRP
jgi:hypothetical protein